MSENIDWSNVYEIWWYDAVKKVSALEKWMELFNILMYKCTGRELIVPEIIKAWWRLEEFIDVEREIGIDDELLCVLIGEYIALWSYEGEDKSNIKMKKWIWENYSWDELKQIWRDYLQDNV